MLIVLIHLLLLCQPLLHLLIQLEERRVHLGDLRKIFVYHSFDSEKGACPVLDQAGLKNATVRHFASDFGVSTSQQPSQGIDQIGCDFIVVELQALQHCFC